MEFHYPGGRKYAAKPEKEKKRESKPSFGKRGMTLEEDLNESNAFYLAAGLAVIHKKPTPIQIVQVDYKSRSTAVIREAYFRQASTTDYNGLCNGKYIDFEAKETQSATSFPLKNFHEHQIRHMEMVLAHQGIAFVIIRFAKTDELFLLFADKLLEYWRRMESGGRKSIAKKELEENAYPLSYGYQPRIDYLKAIRSILSF